jgi:hypothetical protein
VTARCGHAPVCRGLRLGLPHQQQRGCRIRCELKTAKDALIVSLVATLLAPAVGVAILIWQYRESKDAWVGFAIGVVVGAALLWGGFQVVDRWLLRPRIFVDQPGWTRHRRDDVVTADRLVVTVSFSSRSAASVSSLSLVCRGKRFPPALVKEVDDEMYAGSRLSARSPTGRTALVERVEPMLALPVSLAAHGSARGHVVFVLDREYQVEELAGLKLVAETTRGRVSAPVEPPEN